MCTFNKNGIMEKLTEQEIKTRLQQLPGWDYIEGAIVTSFDFGNFKEAFAVMTRIAFECEAQGHHPDWTNVYKSLTIRLNTNDVGGITENDFNLAHAIESIVQAD